MRVRLLGGFEIEGVAERELGSRKARTLLRVLAVARGRPVPLDRIADVLWGDDVPARPGDQVGVLVSRLRRAVGADRIRRTDAGYALVADWLDVDEIDALVAAAADALGEGRLAVARAATEAGLALARGPLLPDEEGDWVESARGTAAASIGRLHRIAVEAAGLAGDDDAAAALAEAALAVDPYDEVILRALMEAHVAAGRPASALAAYARARSRLVDDLGVSPTPETEAVHSRALAVADGAAVRGRSPSRRATRRVRRFAGRAPELAVLDAALARARAGGTELIVIEGDAGIGKTALVDAWSGALDGVEVLRGRCDELGRDLPLQPIADAVAEHLRAIGVDAATSLVAELGPTLAPLLGPVASSSATTVGDVAESQVRVHAALAAVLARIGGDGPTVLVVEDVHRAAPGTLAWLTFALRRCPRAVLLATMRTGGPPLPAATVRVVLGPLEREAVAELVGVGRADELLERSGGHPLLLSALHEAAGEGLPGSLADAVGAAVDSLGDDVASTLRVAAVLGFECDLDLVAGVSGRSTLDVLDQLEAAERAGLVVERGSRFVFRHDLVREALEASTGSARRAVLHERAARILAARPRPDALAVAVHAHAGGDAALASSSYAAAAAAAAARFDLDAAEEHLAAAVSLAPTATVHVQRARVRISRLAFDDAATDAEAAVSLGGGAAAYEVAGWVAYYRRRYDDAGAYADAAAATAGDDDLRASASALAGRVRHGAGDLRGAAEQLESVDGGATPSVRGIVDVWLAQLRVHQGRPHDALAALARPMIAPDALAHPWAPLHLRFNRIVALGQLARVDEALLASADLDDVVRRKGPVGTRFAGVADNVAAWILRWSGREGEADERNGRALERTGGASGPSGDAFAEPHYVSLLDLADGCLLRGDVAGAAELAARLRALDAWQGTMAWHQRHRLGVLRARIALADGDRSAAAALASAVAGDAATRGAGRYELLARAVLGLADPAIPSDELDAVVGGLAGCAALDGWPLVAALGSQRRVDRWREEAASLAGRVVEASRADEATARRFVDRVLTAASRA